MPNLQNYSSISKRRVACSRTSEVKLQSLQPLNRMKSRKSSIPSSNISSRLCRRKTSMVRTHSSNAPGLEMRMPSTGSVETMNSTEHVASRTTKDKRLNILLASTNRLVSWTRLSQDQTQWITMEICHYIILCSAMMLRHCRRFSQRQKSTSISETTSMRQSSMFAPSTTLRTPSKRCLDE